MKSSTTKPPHAVRPSPSAMALGLLAATALALALSAAPVEAATTRPTPGVIACDFGALANDRTPQGLNIRAEPRADAAILGRLPMIDNIHREKIAADVHVVGVSDGWFLVENAAYGDYDLPQKVPPLYRGRGWVWGRLLTTQLRLHVLKAAPDDNSADVAATDDDYGVTAILDCRGDWLRVEAPLSTNDAVAKPSPPADAPPGMARGWTRGVCVNQRTPCGG